MGDIFRGLGKFRSPLRIAVGERKGEVGVNFTLYGNLETAEA